MDMLRRLLEQGVECEADPSEGQLSAFCAEVSLNEGGRTFTTSARDEGAGVLPAGTSARPPETRCPWADRFGDCYHCPMCGWCTP
jgi:hypothetical protein